MDIDPSLWASVVVLCKFFVRSYWIRYQAAVFGFKNQPAALDVRPNDAA